MKFYKIKRLSKRHTDSIKKGFDSTPYVETEFYKLMKIVRSNGGFLAGGAVQHLFDSSKKIKDFDFFFHYPECEEEDMSLEELEYKVREELEEFDPALKCVSEFLSNDGSRLVTYALEGLGFTVQLVFSLSREETYEECIKDRLRAFDLYNSIFALTLEHGRYVIYTTKKSLYSVRYMFSLLNMTGKISPRNTMLRIAKQHNTGYYTKYAMDKLVEWIEAQKDVSYEFNDFLKELDTYGFEDTEHRIRIPPEMLEAHGKIKTKKKIKRQYSTTGNGS